MRVQNANAHNFLEDIRPIEYRKFNLLFHFEGPADKKIINIKFVDE